MLRIRQIVDPLVPNAQKIINDGLLPANIIQLFSCNKTVKYPPFVYTLHKKHQWVFSHFGIFCEYLLREMIAGRNWRANLYELYISTSKAYTHEDITKIISKEDLYSAMGRFVNIEKYIREEFDEQHVEYDVELRHEIITGHPDIVTPNGVYDVKTVTKFDTPTTKNQALLQITAYLALGRSCGLNIQTIGIVLPFQQETLEYNLKYSEYDHQPFLQLLLELARPRIYTIEQQLWLQMYLSLIGSHTPKIGGSVHNSLVNFYQDGNFKRPCQIFMRSNRGAKSVTLSDADIAQSLSFVITHNIKYFVHASYTINLCHPCGKTGKEPWATNILREDLQLCSVTGGSGVVVHTGKAMNLSEEDAYDAMYRSVLSVLDAATEECPLLIETPCDKGTELCSTPESLAAFYLRFTIEQRKRLKICVDTCHVYAAGYLPYEYLVTFSNLTSPGTIKLIHLNDAQLTKGSGHDGHAWVGEGCIGMTEMLKAIKWCVERNIPMVHE